jgi:hypothetical protein
MVCRNGANVVFARSRHFGGIRPSMPKKPTSRRPAGPPRAPQPKLVRPAASPPPAAPKKLYLVRCTFVGEDRKNKVEGAFRFLLEASDQTPLVPRLGQAVRRLRREKEIPATAIVYVEYIIEVAGLKQGIIVDFERWTKEPRTFEHGRITFNDACAVFHGDECCPTFRFGRAAAPAPAAPPETGRPTPPSGP